MRALEENTIVSSLVEFTLQRLRFVSERRRVTGKSPDSRIVGPLTWSILWFSVEIRMHFEPIRESSTPFLYAPSWMLGILVCDILRVLSFGVRCIDVIEE